MAEEFTLAPMRRLIKKHGNLRISDGATEELRYAIGDFGSKVAKTAVICAKKQGRKTVLARDIRTAVKQIEGR